METMRRPLLLTLEQTVVCQGAGVVSSLPRREVGPLIAPVFDFSGSGNADGSYCTSGTVSIGAISTTTVPTSILAELRGAFTPTTNGLKPCASTNNSNCCGTTAGNVNLPF